MSSQTVAPMHMFQYPISSCVVDNQSWCLHHHYSSLKKCNFNCNIQIHWSPQECQTSLWKCLLRFECTYIGMCKTYKLHMWVWMMNWYNLRTTMICSWLKLHLSHIILVPTIFLANVTFLYPRNFWAHNIIHSKLRI